MSTPSTEVATETGSGVGLNFAVGEMQVKLSLKENFEVDY